MTILPTDRQARKEVPLARCLFDYFPNALAAVAAVSFQGNKQHNGDSEPFWAYDKSTDEADCLLRHFAERGDVDTDGLPHSSKVAWRALAMLERELVAAGAPMPRGARLTAEAKPEGDEAGFFHGARWTEGDAARMKASAAKDPTPEPLFRAACGFPIRAGDSARVVATHQALASVHLPVDLADTTLAVVEPDWGSKTYQGQSLGCAKLADADGRFWTIPRAWLTFQA